MQVYLSFLRGVNVGGQAKLKMAELRAALTQRSMKGVQTYLQSGNVVTQGEKQAPQEVSRALRAAMQSDFDLDIPVGTFLPETVERILGENPFAEKAGEKELYFVLWLERPEVALMDAFKELTFADEEFHIGAHCVYLRCKNGYGKAKLNNNLIERKLKVPATTRNLNTMRAMLKMASEISGA